MNKLLSALLILACSGLQAQNLIPNGGFEKYQKLPEKDGCFNGYISDWSNLNGKIGYPNATPDFLHVNGSDNGRVGAYYYSQVEPYEGDAMMGVIVMPNRPFYEYVSAKVPIQKGKRYELSIYVTNGAPKYCASSGKGFGIHFSEKLPHQTQAEFVEVKPQWTITDDFYTQEWENIRFRFTAPEDYNHLTIGYFNSPDAIDMKPVADRSSDCIYFFVDEISLVEVNDGGSGLVSLNLPKSIKNVSSELGAALAPPAQKPVLTAKVSVKDKNNGMTLPAAISVVDLSGNSVVWEETLSGDKNEATFSIPDVGLRYGVFAKSSGYVEGSEKIEPMTLTKDSTILREIRLSPIKKGEKIVLKNIYFDTGKYELLPASFPELQKLGEFMAENPDVKIEISGHTDSQGSDESNQVLSNNRAKAVFNYMIAKVDKARMTYKGYGETTPISSNDTPEGRQENRRVEFKIL